MDTKPRQNVRNLLMEQNLIAISSAKGGVGKSTFAKTYLALKKSGCKVGLLDAIFMIIITKLFSINEKPKSDGKI